MAEKKPNNQEGQVTPAAGNGNSGLIKIIAIVGVVVILVCAGIAYGVSRLVISATGQQSAKVEGSTTNSESLGTSYDVGTFTTNVSAQDGTPAHIVKVKVVFFLNDAKLSAEMDNKKPMIEDFIIKMLRSKSFEELNKPDAADKIKKEIKEKVNTFLATGRVDNVFITDFITQ